MAQTNYTLEMLQTLEAAIANGVRDCYYGDKRVSYRTLDEMIRIRDIMREELGLTKPNGGRKFATHSKGL
jgi:hypothetical protein